MFVRQFNTDTMKKINLIDTTPKSETYKKFKNSFDGIDNGKCLYRAIINQQESGMDINFGIVVVRNKYNTLPDTLNYMGWCVPYDYHVWNEDDDNIYDCFQAFKDNGINLPENPNTITIDWNGKNIKTLHQLQVAMKKLIKNMRNSKADVIYVCGVAEECILDVIITWDNFEEFIQRGCNNIQEVTGTTMNNVVEYV